MEPTTYGTDSAAMHLLVANIRDYAIYMLNPDGNVVSWNAGAERFKGYAAQEILGRHFSQFHTAEDQAAGIPGRALDTAKAEGKFECEGWRVRKDGKRFWAHVVIDAIRDRDGKLIGFAKITRDITEKRIANESLEQAKAQLFQSQKMESLGQLTGGVAHDFNNLLSIISSAVQILNRQNPTSVERSTLDTIQRAVDRGATMTQQLLAFARQQPLTSAHHQINKVISGFELVLRRALSSSIDFSITLSPEAGWIDLDEARFEAALLNLVVNARDAMPDGGRLDIATARRTIGLGASSTLAAGEYVQITVSDSGHGMAPEVMSRVFEPFFTTKQIGKGTGLGLSQVEGFIVQSGGQVEIESAPDQGTRIHLLLPALDIGADVDEVAAPTSETVIIAEDEEELAQLAGSLFETLGYVVLIAHNGRDALRLLAKNPNADLLFSDVMMPGMDGVELGRTARALYPQLKIILASGYAIPALRSAGGIDEFDFVAKPYRLSEIVKKLR
jgi:PAS domain S-box-containing protein